MSRSALQGPEGAAEGSRGCNPRNTRGKTDEPWQGRHSPCAAPAGARPSGRSLYGGLRPRLPSGRPSGATRILSTNSSHRQAGWGLAAVAAACLLAAAGCGRSPAPKVVILGIDGLDPRLLREFAAEGHLPHFSRLMQEGDFKPLQTTMPPLSPVAWSTFITGMDPAGHGIYDFLGRDPETLLPEFSMARTTPSDWNLTIGSWVLPLKGGTIEQLRKGKPFWDYLEERDIPTTLFRMPVNFPPASAGHTLSGMGTPDILGTPGTFTFFTDHPPDNAEEMAGGRVVRVSVRNHQVRAQLEGPDNTFRRVPKPPPPGQSRRGRQPVEYMTPKMAVDLQVDLDPERAVARLRVQDQEFILQQGEWSDWVPIDFEAVPYVVSVGAVARFYLQQVRPEFRLYLSPLQINPAEPAMPISTPDSWAGALQRKLGYYYTQELPEDTKAFSGRIFNGEEFWQQSQFVYREQRRALDYALENHRDGLLFFYFSSVDQGCHMLWRYRDAGHPFYQEHDTLKTAIRTLYQEMDEALGRIRQAIDDQTTLIVMSDHGFSPFYRGVNLNSWLADRGYARLRNPTLRDGHTAFTNVDWTNTRAYAVGLNGVYVNLRGRERDGIVSQGQEFDRLLDALEAEMLALRDDRTGERVITSVVRPRRDYAGDQTAGGPDLIVGYNWGYRSSWQNPLGEFPRAVFVDNDDPWSGDHSIDARFVPGVLLTNRRITLEEPALYDLTVAILDQYGIARPEQMKGRDCLQ